MKITKARDYEGDRDPPRWVYSVSDGITGTRVWSHTELSKENEALVYKKLKEYLKEENTLGSKH